jgi:hypothetical protein
MFTELGIQFFIDQETNLNDVFNLYKDLSVNGTAEQIKIFKVILGKIKEVSK